jgi:hypothetical protein
MKPANPRERLRSAFRGEPWSERAPWAPLVDGYYLSSREKGVDALEANKRVAADALVRHVFAWSSEIFNRRGSATARRRVSAADEDWTANGVTMSMRCYERNEGLEMIRTWTLEGHSLTERHMFTTTSPFIPFPLDFPLKTVEDLRVYGEMIKRDRFHPAFDDFAREDRRIGDAGMATDTSPVTPFQQLIQHLVGIEGFYAEMLPDHPGEVDALIRTMHEKQLEAYGVLAASPAEVVIGYENTSTTLISPDLYSRYGQPYIDDYADVLHGAGKIYLTHRCGKLAALLPQIARGRDDGIADLSPAPTGDVSLWDARAALPRKIVFGGLDATVLAAASDEAARSVAREIVARIDDTRGVILGSGDAVPQNARPENLAAVSAVAAGWRAYRP